MYNNYSEAKKAADHILELVGEFTGGDRETYLRWVRDWKIAYNTITHIIRDLKAARKQGRYEYSRAEGQKRKVRVGDNPTYDRDAAWFYRAIFEPAANELLERRKAAKEVAAEERRARLEGEQQAA